MLVPRRSMEKTRILYIVQHLGYDYSPPPGFSWSGEGLCHFQLLVTGPLSQLLSHSWV